MGAKPRLYELAEAMTLLSPRQWVRWRALSRRLHREIPSIAIPDTDLAVAHQLLRRIDLVAYVLNLSPTAHRLRTLYLAMVDALFAAGAAGRITATYIDYQDRGQRKPVRPEHWIGQMEPVPDVRFFAFDAGPGWDQTKWLGPADDPFKPVDPADRFQPDRRIRLRDNELRPRPDLILSDVYVEFPDATPKPARGRRPFKVKEAIKSQALAYLQQHGVPSDDEKGLTAFRAYIDGLCRNHRKRPLSPSTNARYARDFIAEYKENA